MVFAGNNDVVHAGVLGDFDPLVGVEFDGIEFLGKPFVFGAGDFATVHDPLADAAHGLVVVKAGGNRIDTPMNEHAELGLAPPTHARVALGLGFRLVARLSGGGDKGRQPQPGDQAVAKDVVFHKFYLLVISPRNLPGKV